MSYSDDPAPMPDRAEEPDPFAPTWWLSIVVIALCAGAVVLAEMALR